MGNGVVRTLSREGIKECNMQIDKRKSKRTDIDVTIKLKEIKDNYHVGLSKAELSVDVVNVSKDGIAFASKEILALNVVYDTNIVLANGERFEAIIEIVRMESIGEEETLYGCRFIGINSEDQFKIDVYQILYESNRL